MSTMTITGPVTTSPCRAHRTAPDPIGRPAEAGRPDRELRLTRRGRLAVFLACLALALTALVVVAGSAIGTAEPGTPVPARSVTVQPGDTLWGIAAETRPGEDPRVVVHEITELNGLSGQLQIGDEIAVPLP